MTDKEILALAREVVAKEIYYQAKGSDWPSWDGLWAKPMWLREADSILSLRLNEKGEPDPEGNIRVGVYLEAASTWPFEWAPAGFRKVV